MIVTGTVKDGKLSYSEEERKRYSRHISKKPDGTVVRIEFTTPKAARSVPQNRYYWGVVIAILSEYLWLTSDEVHEVLKHLHLNETVRPKFDRRRRIVVPKSTTDLDTMEFEAYLERCREWARKILNCRIPLPNEIPDYAYFL